MAEPKKLSINEIIANGPTWKIPGIVYVTLVLCVVEFFLISATATTPGNYSTKAFDLFMCSAILGFFLLIFILTSLKLLFESKKKATLDYFNENNDGFFYHYCNKTAMLIDSNKSTITLANNNIEKTYSFNDIKKWSHKGKEPLSVWVKDISNPVWHIDLSYKKPYRNDDQKMRDIKAQLDVWMEIFDQVVNKNTPN